ncbi:MAG: hypothetical protein AAGF97_19475, partial [Planctomycetota bacterium]
IGGLYGIAHDQVTYSISPEYFTKLKFHQFHYADFGLGDRVFAATIGFVATWWVGFFAAWFLARKLIPRQARAFAYRQVGIGFGIITCTGLVFGVVGYLVGSGGGPATDYSAWDWVTKDLAISDVPAFVQVAIIHQGGYLGGLVGLIVTLLVLKPQPKTA